MSQGMQDLIINDLVTLLGSVVLATWVLGVKYGSINSSLDNIKMRLARIEGMFELRIKKDE